MPPYALNTDAGQVELRRRRRARGLCHADRRRRSTRATRWRRRVPAATAPGPRQTTPSTSWPAGLSRVEQYRFPRDLNESVRVYFERWAPMAPPELAVSGPRAGRRPARRSGHRDARAVAVSERADSHHLRGDPAPRRHLRKRLAGAGPRRGELPHPAAVLAGGRGGNAARPGGSRRHHGLAGGAGARRRRVATGPAGAGAGRGSRRTNSGRAFRCCRR